MNRAQGSALLSRWMTSVHSTSGVMTNDDTKNSIAPSVLASALEERRRVDLCGIRVSTEGVHRATQLVASLAAVADFCQTLIEDENELDPDLLRIALIARDNILERSDESACGQLAARLESVLAKAREARDALLLSSERLPTGWCVIPAGSFMMGAYGDRDEGPLHRVVVTRPFLMLSTPTTQSLWARLMTRRPSSWTGPQRPVDGVSWYECVAFCNLLSIEHGLSPCYYEYSGGAFRPVQDSEPKEIFWDDSMDGYRLPTEAEWEYACRAGDTRQYPSKSGEAETNRAKSMSGHVPPATYDVGQSSPNNWGLYDMQGNVREWCWDRFASYAPGKYIDPRGAAVGNDRVYRKDTSTYDKLVNISSVSCRGGNWPWRGNGCGGGIYGFRPVRRWSTLAHSKRTPNFLDVDPWTASFGGVKL